MQRRPNIPRVNGSYPPRNPYLRPKRVPAQEADLPPVVDHRGDPCPVCGVRHEVRFAVDIGETYSDTNFLAWRIWYRLESAGRRVSPNCLAQQILADSEVTAIKTLRRLCQGRAVKIHLFSVERPCRNREGHNDGPNERLGGG